MSRLYYVSKNVLSFPSLLFIEKKKLVRRRYRFECMSVFAYFVPDTKTLVFLFLKLFSFVFLGILLLFSFINARSSCLCYHGALMLLLLLEVPFLESSRNSSSCGWNNDLVLRKEQNRKKNLEKNGWSCSFFPVGLFICFCNDTMVGWMSVCLFRVSLVVVVAMSVPNSL